MVKKNRIEGYIYKLSKADVKNLMEFKNISDSDFIELQPSIFILKSGRHQNKTFTAFVQIGDYSQQIICLPVCNCTSVMTPFGEFTLPYEETFDGIANYLLDLIKSRRVHFADLISNYKNKCTKLNDILGGVTHD